MRPFTLFFVCTGNRFRSALAEAFVRRLTIGLPVTTESFGTLDLGSVPALPEAVEIALACDLDLSGHRTRCVRGASLGDADLVLGFDQAHVHDAVVEADAPRDRSFTSRHFARLLDELTPAESAEILQRARRVVEQAGALRGNRPPSISDDMRDPLGASWRVYRETALEIRDLSLGLASALFGVATDAGLPPVPPKLRRRGLVWRR